MKIYSVEYLTPSPQADMQILLDKMPANIRHKIDRYLRWQDAHAWLYGKLLLCQALKDVGLPTNLDRLQYTAHGRPYLADGPDFNISHSGNRVVCVLSNNGRVGIDLEEMKALTIEDFKTQFSQQEWDSIVNSTTPLATFYHYWTAKESILKADGRGLNENLQSLDVTTTTIILGNIKWRLLPITVFYKYACHIAFDGPNDPLEIIQLPATVLLLT